MKYIIRVRYPPSVDVFCRRQLSLGQPGLINLENRKWYRAEHLTRCSVKYKRHLI